MINAHVPKPSETVEEMPQCFEDVVNKEEPILKSVNPCLSKEQREQRRRLDILKNWEINIQFHDIGCVVRVGCKSFAFESVSAAMQVVNQYTDDPAAVAKAYGFEGRL